MGNKASKSTGNKKKSKISAQFTAFLVGIAGSGKTTFFKQMRFIYQKDFSDEERNQCKEILIQNVFSGISEVITEIQKQELALQPENLKLPRHLSEISNNMLLTTISQAEIDVIVKQIKSVWDDPAFQKIWKNLVSGDNSSGVKFHETLFLNYHMKNIANYFTRNYIVSDDDLLRARQRTTGYSSNEIVIKKKYHWTFVDVGGQLVERDKWNEVMEAQSAKNIVKNSNLHYKVALFFVPIDEFNSPSTSKGYEGANKFDEALDVFKMLIQGQGAGKWLTGIVVFFNKMDLFTDKWNTSQKFRETFKKFFVDEKTADAEGAAKFLSEKFRADYDKHRASINNDEDILKIHLTCALDTKAMSVVFESLRANLLTSSFSDNGIVL